jgi:hypothetical protein
MCGHCGGSHSTHVSMQYQAVTNDEQLTETFAPFKDITMYHMFEWYILCAYSFSIHAITFAVY